MKTPKHKLKNLKISEISFVDRPAVEGAVARLMKFGDATLFYKTRSELNSEKPKPISAPTMVKQKDLTMPETFEAAVAQFRKGGLSRTAALSTSRSQYPALYEAYQGVDLTSRGDGPLTKSEAVLAFEKAVDTVQSREGCSRLEALRKAAKEYPEALEAYRYA